MKNTLACTGYSTRRSPGDPVEIHASFVLIDINGRNTEDVAIALANIERYLSQKIDIVAAAPRNKTRCFHCAVLNDSENNTCSQCGASL